MIRFPSTLRLIPVFLILLVHFNSYAQKTEELIQNGKASLYANRFEGKRTASGEKYHHESFTAAHRSLAFGTWVKVVNQANQKAVIVQINDRGPFVKGRIIDLSRSAAEQLGGLNQGVFTVSVEVYQKDLNFIQLKNISNPISPTEQFLMGL